MTMKDIIEITNRVGIIIPIRRRMYPSMDNLQSQALARPGLPVPLRLESRIWTGEYPKKNE